MSAQTKRLPGNQRNPLQIADIERTLRLYKGSIARSADELGVSRNGLWKRIDGHVRLRQVLKDSRESMVDNAESALSELVDGKHFGAIKTVLLNSKEGRARGWSSAPQSLAIQVGFDTERIAEPRDADGNVLELPSEIE